MTASFLTCKMCKMPLYTSNETKSILLLQTFFHSYETCESSYKCVIFFKRGGGGRKRHLNI